MTLPPGAVDCHCHLYGPFDRFPLPAEAAYAHAEATFEQYEALRARLQISRAVIVQPAPYGSDHRMLLDALERGAGRYSGVALVDERTSIEELERLHAAGVRGARFHFFERLGRVADWDRIARVAERISPLGWHLLLHVDGPTLGRRALLFERLPLPYVIDHLARIDAGAGTTQPAFAALQQLQRDPHCWVKISALDRLTHEPGPPYDDVVPFARAVVSAAPDRVLWGTDWPHPNARAVPDDAEMVALLFDCVPDAAQRTRILVENPRRLYDFAA